MANTLSLMTNVLRNAVSKQRIRYTENGFNLDLAYICENIIAMGYPADNYEGIYRNRIDDVYQFFEGHHKDHYKIYNLCSERGYDVNKFHGRVAVYPFDDHNPPTIELIQKFCDDVDRWLKADKKNVAAVHCKAGKGRTGTMICCYLLHSGFRETAEEALAFYDEKRTKDKKGVTIPSQRRYVEYYSRLIGSEKPYEKQTIEICEIKFSSPLQSQGSVHYNISNLPGPSAAEKVQVISSGTIDFRKSQSIEFKDENIKLTGDVKIEVYHKIMRKKEKYFHFWFNTYFICDENERRLDQGDGKFIREFTKYELDDAHKDKEHKNFPEDFKVQIVLKPVSPQQTTYSNCNDVPHNNHFVLRNQAEVKYTTEQQQQQQLFLQKQQQLQHIQYNNSSQQQQPLQNNLYKNNLIASMQISPNAALLAPGIGTAPTVATNLGPIFEPTSSNDGRSSYPSENHDKYIQSQLQQQQQHFQPNVDSKRRSMPPLQYHHHTNDKMQYLHQSHHHQQQQQQQQPQQQNHNNSHNNSEKDLMEFYSAAVAASSGNTLVAAGMSAKNQDQRNLVATNLGAPVKPNQSGSNQMHPEHHHYLQHHNNPPTKIVHNNQHHTPSVSPDVSRTNSSSSNHSKLSKSSNCSGNTSQNCNSNSSSSSSSSSSISSEASSAAAEEDWESGELKVKGTSSSTSTYMMMMMDGKNVHPMVSSSSSVDTNNLINLKDNLNFQNDNKNIINNNTNIKINNKNNSNNNNNISKCSSDIIMNKSLVLDNVSYNNSKNNNNSNVNNNNNKSSNNNDGSNIFKFIKMKKNSSNDNNCSDKNGSNNSNIDCSSSCSKNDDSNGSKSLNNKQNSTPSSAYSKLISFVAKPATQNFKAKAINAKISCNNKINNTKKKIRWFTKSAKTDPMLCETLVKPISYRDVGSSISSNINNNILNNGNNKSSSISQNDLLQHKENNGNDDSDLVQDRKNLILQHKNSLLQKQRSLSSGTDHDDYYSSLCDRQLSFGTSPCKSPRTAIIASGTASSTVSQDLHSIRENLLGLDTSHISDGEKASNNTGNIKIIFPKYNNDDVLKTNIVVVNPINTCARIGFNISNVDNHEGLNDKKSISSVNDKTLIPLTDDNLLVRISHKNEDTLSDENIFNSTEEIKKSSNNIASEKQKLISDKMPEEETSTKNKSIIKIFNQNEEQHKICDKLRLLTMSTASSLSSSSASGNSSSSPSLSSSSSFSILSLPSTPQSTPTAKEIEIASNQFNTSAVIEEEEKQEDSVAFQSGNRCIPFSLRGIRQELLQTVIKSSSNLNNKIKANRSNSCTFPSSSASSNSNNTSNSTNRFSLSSYYKKKNSLPATLLPICSSSSSCSSSFTTCTATIAASSPSPLERVKLLETIVTAKAPIPTEIEIVNLSATSLPSSSPLSTSLERRDSSVSFLEATEETGTERTGKSKTVM